MAVKVIVELQAKPGGRDELRSFLDNLISTAGAYAPLLELVAAPFRATVIKQLP